MKETEGHRFDEIFQKMDRAYERYAKSMGMNYSSLALLQLIWERQPCTQKTICALTMLPKQTVNTIVLSFYRQGLLEMLELAEDRRHKTILLSEKGPNWPTVFSPKSTGQKTAVSNNLPTRKKSPSFVFWNNLPLPFVKN